MEKFTQIKKINEEFIPMDFSKIAKNVEVPTVEVNKSEPAKFLSKIFESRQMAHVFHLQATGEGAYSKHVALDNYYNSILEINDELIEVYQGQYDIIENYEIIEGEPKSECIEYFIDLAEFIKSTRKIAFLEEDTHLQNIIDEMVSLIYRTIYKLKNLK